MNTESFKALTLSIGFLVMSALLLSACGGGGASVGGPGNGRLEIENANDSLDEIVDIEVIEEFGTRTYDFDVSLLPGEVFEVTDLFPGNYTVNITWRAGDGDSESGVFVANEGETNVTFRKQ